MMYGLTHRIEASKLEDWHSVHSLVDTSEESIVPVWQSVVTSPECDEFVACLEQIQGELDQSSFVMVQLVSTTSMLYHAFVMAQTMSPNNGKRTVVRVESYEGHYGGRIVEWTTWKKDLHDLVYAPLFATTWEKVFDVRPDSSNEHLRIVVGRHDGKIALVEGSLIKRFHPFLERGAFLEYVYKMHPSLANVSL